MITCCGGGIGNMKKLIGILVLTLLITTTVLPLVVVSIETGQDEPPLVVIQSPADGTTFNSPNITITGYATDDIGVIGMFSHHEWTGGEATKSYIIGISDYFSFNLYRELHEGWNRITISVIDTKNQYAEDQIVVYYSINQPPMNPSILYKRSNDKLIIKAIDGDGDQIRYGISWYNNGNVDLWTDFYDSGEETRVDVGGRTGTVGVLAEDEHGAQSDWVSVKSKSRPYCFSFFEWFIQYFPFFEKILKQIII